MSERPSPEPQKSKLRGSLVPSESSSTEKQVRPEDDSPLRGSLLGSKKAEPAEEPGLPSRLINRDSGEEWEVASQIETRYGVMVKIKASDGSTFTKGRDQFIADLNKEGSPWKQA